jgi:3-oxoacyl-[acyl-carrier-protein] synthase II
MVEKVVITGIGGIAPNGLDTDAIWRNFIAGVSSVDTIKAFDTEGMPVKIGGEIRGFDLSHYGFDDLYKEYDRTTQLGLAASKLALEDSGLELDNLDPGRIGCIIGNAGGSLCSCEDIFYKYYTNKNINGKVDKSHFRLLLSRVIAKYYDFRGVNQIISTGCTSGLDAVGLAYYTLLDNNLDVVLTGGVEAPVTPTTVSSFAKIGALSFRNDNPRKASRPYDKDRDGFVLAEGAGLLVLEKLSYARKRGARIYAEVKGFASNSSAYHMTGIPRDGKPVSEVLKKTLKNSKINREDIDYINSHGSSTPMNDIAETNAYKDTFRDQVYKIPISSIKSMIGHCLGAIGGIEVLTCAMVLNEQVIPPTINLEEPDKECNLDYVPNVAREANVNNILTNGSGFSGLNSAIVLSKI